MRIRALALVLAASIAAPPVLLPTRVAIAQGMDADTKEAKVLFEDGVKFYKAGKFEEARVKFKAAYGLKKRPSIVLNLANAELATKRPLDAIVHFKEVLAMPDAKPDDKDEAKIGLGEARKQVGIIVIDAPTGSPVTIDGQTWGVPPDGTIEVMPGPHTIVLKGPAKEVIEKVNLAPGQQVNISPKGAEAPPPPGVVPPPAGTAPPPAPTDAPPVVAPPPPTPTPPPSDTKQTQGFFQTIHPVTYVAAGVTVIALVGFIGFAMKAGTHDDNIEKLNNAVNERPTCNTPLAAGRICTSEANKAIYRQQGREEIEKADSARTLSTVFGVTAILAAGATVATFILLRKKDGSVAFVTSPTYGGASFSLVGSF